MSYVVTLPKNGPRVAHHPTCSVVDKLQSATIEMFLPPNTVTCSRCKGEEYVTRATQVREQFEIPTKSKRKTGRYRVDKGIKIPVACPNCGGTNIERENSRMWFCWSCPWMGAVNSTWTEGDEVNIRDQIADAAIRWAKAKDAEASKDERKLESTVSYRNDQDQALAEIRQLAREIS